MKTKLIITFAFLLTYDVNAQSKFTLDSILYEQNLSRDDKMFTKIFASRRGKLFLTSDSLIFISKKVKNNWLNFSLSYKQIAFIKRVSWISSFIKIKTKNGYTFRLFTYKRRNIIRITKERIDSF